MKKISIAIFAGVLFFAACSNPNSPTEGDWSKEESAEKTEHTTEHGAAGSHEGAEEKTSDTTMVNEMGTEPHH